MQIPSNNFEIIPFSNEDDYLYNNNIRTSLKKSNSVINLKKTKIHLKNVVIYRPKWTPNYFYKHEIFLKQRKERINNAKKYRLNKKLEENYSFQPEINLYSKENITEINNNTYTPIYLRSIEYNNLKKAKNIINEKLKEKKIEEMMKMNNSSYFIDDADADLFYYRQKNWKKKIEEK